MEFVPEVASLISAINERLAGAGGGLGDEFVCAVGRLSHTRAAGAAATVDVIRASLDPTSAALFESLPLAIKLQLLLDRDPHGNVQVSKIETEKLLCGMMEARIAERTAAGEFAGAFASQFHFFGCAGAPRWWCPAA